MPRPIRYRRRRPGEAAQFAVPLNQPRGPRPGPEILPWYWHPNREGAIPPPAAFTARLKEIHPDLAVCWSPVHERWLIWVKNPARKNSLCTGWSLIFLWEHPITHEPLELNELVFHNLFLVDRERFPNAAEYYDRIAKEVELKKEALIKAKQEEERQVRQDFVNGLRPSNVGSGSKCALYDGDGLPSQGEQNWRAETRKHRLPSAFIQQENEDREKREYGS